MEIVTLFLIAIALSMDAFSIALFLGTTVINFNKKIILISFIGLFHFVFPLLGYFLSEKIVMIFKINSKLLVSGILIYLAYEMIKNSLKNDFKITNFNLFAILTLAFSVSLDSLSIGIGLKHLSSRIFLASTLFLTMSVIWTIVGLLIGAFAKKKIGLSSNLIGAIILIMIAIISLCK